MIEFAAALAGTNSRSNWLTAGIDGDVTIRLEVPRSETAAIMKLFLLGKKPLVVTIRVDE